jgi:hypothetical protein
MFVSGSGWGKWLAAVAAVTLGLSSWGAGAAEEVPATQAVWTAKPVRFTYMGFTAKYSCDGLRDRVRKLLLDLGARSDLKLNSTGCSSGYGRPSPFPGVSGTVNVLELLGDNAPTPEQPVISTHWKSVTISPQGEALAAAGECELIEQLKTRLLPLFTARNVEYSSTCIPNQLTPGSTRLRAEVLIADPAAAKAP